MKCELLLCVCWCCLCGAASCGEVVIHGRSCVSDYLLTITCLLNITQNPVGHTETDYRLEFLSDIGEMYSCLLVRVDQSYSCSIDANATFYDYDTFEISLCHTHGCQAVVSGFNPSKNIQLTPPRDVKVQTTPENLNITWRSGYEEHEYLSNTLSYQLKLWHEASSRRNKILLNLETKSTSIRRSHLEPDALYCIAVRSRPVWSSYGSIWSSWSQPMCFRTEAGEDEDNMLVELMGSVGSVCVAAGVLLVFIFFSPAARMQIKSWCHTPTPAPFFQPLFQQYEGNLKEWVSPQHDVILKCETEEILKMELVTVEPKTIRKDPEEEQDLQKPTVLQCQTSYVGFPGVGVASPPSHAVCLVDSSYTPLPWPTWGPGVVEEVPVSSPKHFLDNSSVDSAGESCGSSFDDSSQSPECSLPSSLMMMSPSPSAPPCFCQDYCILNKTSEGVVPVFLPKESRNVPSGDNLHGGEN
ncbi:interleukin-21 receptor-like [Genypterus blacodes]|uniref:interleukin-21 receptor-like n=1 Tax=Genypterus blacodes TaxID=154954 RepID=UPI003F75918A